jgi:hypothetical protein
VHHPLDAFGICSAGDARSIASFLGAGWSIVISVAVLMLRTVDGCNVNLPYVMQPREPLHFTCYPRQRAPIPLCYNARP